MRSVLLSKWEYYANMRNSTGLIKDLDDFGWLVQVEVCRLVITCQRRQVGVRM